MTAMSHKLDVAVLQISFSLFTIDLALLKNILGNEVPFIFRCKGINRSRLEVLIVVQCLSLGDDENEDYSKLKLIKRIFDFSNRLILSYFAFTLANNNQMYLQK